MPLNYRNTSALATALAIVCPTIDLVNGLDINMDASASTATLTVEGSIDSLNWITLDSIVAAASTQKHYGKDTVGAAKALAPLSFAYVRITAGSAGGGNTTTLTVTGS